ncbi:MAG TPA: hypothetical protein VFM88_03730 [Vicinamibacteria bacterium]|nr:hypothetical protein [Vicinamibacteria bacterium]
MRAVLRSSVFPGFLFVFLAAPAPAQEAQPAADEVRRLEAEIAALREDFAGRLAALEAKLAALEAPAPTPAEVTPSPAPPEAPQPVAPAQAAPAPTVATPPLGSKVFNPDIAVIGNFLGAAGENDSPDAPPSLQMEEAEASFQAIVDPYARADFFLTFGPEEVGIEEGFVTFPTVPGGLLVKIGKMRDAFGKVNAMHAHMLPWTDRPLVVGNLVGGEEGLADSGVSVSRLIPNRFLFLEATGQVYQGSSEIFAAPKRSDLAYVGHLRAYRDLGESSNIDLGGSFAYGHNGATDDTTTRLWGADLTFRWRPLRRAIYRRFLARTELVWSRREGEEAAASSFGWYGSAEYQFARRWFLGARYDWSERAFDPSLEDKGGSLLLTWWPSEFSQIRGQFRRTEFADGQTANELLFQFLFSIGAHGAHPF